MLDSEIKRKLDCYLPSIKNINAIVYVLKFSIAIFIFRVLGSAFLESVRQLAVHFGSRVSVLDSESMS